MGEANFYYFTCLNEGSLQISFDGETQ